MWSFTCVSWGYFPSADISFRPQFRHFLPSFLCCYLFSKWNIYFFILVFSDPILFNLFSHVLLFLSSIFYLSPLSFFEYPLFLFLHFLSLSFSIFYFLSSYLLSISSDFLCLSFNFSFCFYFFIFYLLSWLFSTFILCLSSIIFPLLFLSFCAFMFFLLSVFSFCSSYQYFLPFKFSSAFSAYFSTFFFLFCFSYFVLVSTLFNYLVLMLDFNYCKFSLCILQISVISSHSPLVFSLLRVNLKLFHIPAHAL